MVKLERDLMKQISNRLEIYRITKQVIWFTRLQSGKVRIGQYYIKLCEEGTPDWLALVWSRKLSLISLFIEAKSDKGKLRKEQEEFCKKYTNDYITVLTIRDIKELDNWIDNNSYDYVKDL